MMSWDIKESIQYSQLLRERFYWQNMRADVRHRVKFCQQCQIRSIQKVELPLTVSTPTALFVKIYVDMMLMPKAHGYRYIVAARDDLSGKAEGRALKKAMQSQCPDSFGNKSYADMDMLAK